MFLTTPCISPTYPSHYIATTVWRWTLWIMTTHVSSLRNTVFYFTQLLVTCSLRTLQKAIVSENINQRFKFAICNLQFNFNFWKRYLWLVPNLSKVIRSYLQKISGSWHFISNSKKFESPFVWYSCRSFSIRCSRETLLRAIWLVSTMEATFGALFR